MFRLLVTSLVLVAVPLSVNAGWQFNGVPVCTAPWYQVNPLIVSDGAGGAIIVWNDVRSGAYDIYAQRLNAAGVPQWTPDGVPLCTAAGSQETISVVSDDAGGAVVVWDDGRNTVGSGLDIFAQRVDGSGTPLWTADGVALCTEGDDQRAPIIIRSANNFVVAWSDPRFAAQPDIYVQALNPSGAPQWMMNGVQLCSATGFQVNPRLCTDGIGGAIVTWEDLRGGSTRDIYARFVDRFGAVQWSFDGVVVCNAAADQYEPQIVGDGAAGAILAWYDWRSGPADIYMQRLNYAGTSLWGANGTPICTAGGIQYGCSLAQDFSGGAVVVWGDHRSSPSTPHIYAQRVDVSGNPLWSPNGEPVCTAPGLQLGARVVRGPFGHLVTWSDYRSGNADIYAQRLDYESGAGLWGSQGVVLGTESHAQEYPAITTDGGTGAIVAWRDLRDGSNFDIYAEHIDGTPTPVSSTPPVSSLQVFAYPNPFSDETTLTVGLPSQSDVNVVVFDVSGRRLREYSLPQQARGWRTLRLDSHDGNGALLPSGVYFCRVRAGGNMVTSKMVIAR